jgi:hypothetical protein
MLLSNGCQPETRISIDIRISGNSRSLQSISLGARSLATGSSSKCRKELPLARKITRSGISTSCAATIQPTTPRWCAAASATRTYAFLVDITHDLYRSATMTPLDALLTELSYRTVEFLSDTAPDAALASILSEFRREYCVDTRLDAADIKSGMAKTRITVVRMRRIWRLPFGERRLRFTPVLSSSPGPAPTHDERFLAETKVAASAPTSAMICCAESAPKPGTSASRSTASWCWRNRLAISWSSWPICCSINCKSSSAIFTSRR